MLSHLQNSVDITWQMLLEPKYKSLRRCIYSNFEEMKRFRELLVNAVMATGKSPSAFTLSTVVLGPSSLSFLYCTILYTVDIADKRLQALRKNRWNDAFAEEEQPQTDMFDKDDNLSANRKATIIYEHLIQASDVSHTMQHWNTFRKFNARLFEERYVAWLRGVAGEDDPSVNW